MYHANWWGFFFTGVCYAITSCVPFLAGMVIISFWLQLYIERTDSGAFFISSNTYSIVEVLMLNCFFRLRERLSFWLNIISIMIHFCGAFFDVTATNINNVVQLQQVDIFATHAIKNISLLFYKCNLQETGVHCFSCFILSKELTLSWFWIIEISGYTL